MHKLCVFVEVFRLDVINEDISIYQLVSASPCEYRSSSTAFLFSLVNKPGWGPVKFRQTEAAVHDSSGHAIHTCSSYGPTFGRGTDIHIASEASTNKKSHANFGYSYNQDPTYNLNYGTEFAASFMAGSLFFQPDEVEVFYETNFK